MSQTIHDQNNSRRVRTHEKNSGETVRRLGTIVQSIFCAQSGAGIRLNFWKWSGESRYPGALPPLLGNFRRALSPDPTDCPWVSEDGPDRPKSKSGDISKQSPSPLHHTFLLGRACFTAQPLSALLTTSRRTRLISYPDLPRPSGRGTSLFQWRHTVS